PGMAGSLGRGGHVLVPHGAEDLAPELLQPDPADAGLDHLHVAEDVSLVPHGLVKGAEGPFMDAEVPGIIKLGRGVDDRAHQRWFLRTETEMRREFGVDDAEGFFLDGLRFDDPGAESRGHWIRASVLLPA